MGGLIVATHIRDNDDSPQRRVEPERRRRLGEHECTTVEVGEVISPRANPRLGLPVAASVPPGEASKLPQPLINTSLIARSSTDKDGISAGACAFPQIFIPCGAEGRSDP